MRNCSRINNSPAAYAILCSSFKRDLTNFGAAICSSQKDCFVRLLQTDHHKKKILTKRTVRTQESSYSSLCGGTKSTVNGFRG